MPFSSTVNVHAQFVAVASFETSARNFLMSEGLLRSSISCSTLACGKHMELKVCAASKSPDLLHWWCSSCHRSTALRSGSLLSGKKITFVNFVHLLFLFSVKGLGGSSISELSGLGEDTVSAWRKILTDEVTCWFTRTSKPIGGEGTFVEIDEAKFRRMKHHRGAARAETWVLGGVQRDTNDCFLVPCPGVNGMQRFSYLLSRDGFFQVPLFKQIDGGPIDNFLNVDITMTG